MLPIYPFLSTEAQIAQKLSKSLVSLSAIVTFEFPLLVTMTMSYIIMNIHDEAFSRN